MKLNVRRTLCVGFAFLSICAFWQLYDNVVPWILKNTFHLEEGPTGFIMSIDNILALFMLPLFGALSDRTKTRLGRRTPYVIGGTLVAVVLMNLLPFSSRSQNFPLFLGALIALLVAMGTYRSPAVALMPDVTPKPLRSKGNAIINLMGTLGGTVTLGLTMVLPKLADGSTNFPVLFLCVAVLMLAAVVVLVLTVRENKLTQEVEAVNATLDAEELASQPEQERQAEVAAQNSARSGFRSLSPEVRKSLLLILFSVFLWFMGYNAVTTAFTRYADTIWGVGLSTSSALLMIATGAALVSYVPIGIFSSRFGRKRMIQFGVALLALCFALLLVFTSLSPLLYVLFALVGIAWAAINVNSYPMVVEISNKSDVGQFTGYYYTFSMAAQIITPTLSGYLIQFTSYRVLAPYAAIMVALSFITISLTKHGDARPEPKKSTLEAFDVGDD